MANNFLEVQAKNKRTTVVLIVLYVLLFVCAGASVDATLMAGIGSLWFSLFGIVALSFLVPLWLARFIAHALSLFRSRGIVDEYGYDEEPLWVPLFPFLLVCCAPVVILVLWAVARGVSFNAFGVIEAKDGVLSSSFPLASISGLLFGGGGAWWASRNGAAAILALSKIRKPDTGELMEKQLVNVVDEMVIAAGIPRPDVRILRDRDSNAFAVSSAGGSGTIVVTWGLLQCLTREELQAVVAHEVAHLRNLDTRVMTLASVLFGSVVVIASWARRGSSLTLSRLPVVFLGPVWVLFGLLSPIASRLVGLAVSRQREYLADASAVELMRNPEALISALTKIEEDSLPTWNIERAVAHHCIADPLGSRVNQSESWWAELYATHPPMKKRLLVLRSMAYQ